MRWERVPAPDGPEGPAEEGREPAGPGRRWGHTCNAVRGGRLLYVFGGYGQDNCQTNDVHVFDAYSQTWCKPMMKGTPPSPRDSHSCTTVGNNLFVFGGTDGKNPLGDLHVLDTLANTWMMPNVTGEGPAAREGHSATLVDKRLFIFGGCGKSCDDPEELYYNDLFILDTDNFVWHRAITSGNPPSARDSHTCSSWKNLIIVIGGEDFSDYYLSDVYIFDVDNFIWRELKTSGQVLTPRAGHATVAFGKHMFVFGGFTDERNLYDDLYVLNVETGVWNKISSEGSGPSARFSVAGDCLDGTKGVLLFLGGCNKGLEALDDMYYLYTDMLLENGQEDPRQEKLSLGRELKKKHPQQYILPLQKGLSMGNISPNIYQPVTLEPCHQGNLSLEMSNIKFPSQKMFEAKVTDMFHCGYMIETIIDGKPLRGILFSYNPDFGNDGESYISRKRVIAGGNGIQNGYDVKSKIARTDQKINNSGNLQADNCQGKASISKGPPMLPANIDSSNLATVAVLHSQPVYEKVELSPAPDLNSAPAATDNKQAVEIKGGTGNNSSTFAELSLSQIQDDPAPSNQESDNSFNGLLVKPV